MANEGMSGGGNFRRGHLSRPNRPNWLVCQQNTGELVGGQRARAVVELALEDFFFEAVRTLFVGFADANDRCEANTKCRKRFLCNVIVGLAENLPSPPKLRR